MEIEKEIEKEMGGLVFRPFNKVQCKISLRLSAEGVSERNH